MTSLFGHANGDAAYHREERAKQQCSGDCNQGRECDCKDVELEKPFKDLAVTVAYANAEFPPYVKVFHSRVVAKEIARLTAERSDLLHEVEILIRQRDMLVEALENAIEFVPAGYGIERQCWEALAKIKGE